MLCVTSRVRSIYAAPSAGHGYTLFFTDSDGDAYQMRCNRSVFRFVRDQMPADAVALVGFRILSGSPSYRIATGVYPFGGDFGSEHVDAACTLLRLGGDSYDPS